MIADRSAIRMHVRGHDDPVPGPGQWTVIGVRRGGDLGEARERTRLFMFPGMGHCSGGAGPDQWDPLAPLVAWVENGTAPDSVVARHETDGRVDNERRVCAHPERAVYSGPAGGANDRANWVAGNFRCEAPR